MITYAEFVFLALGGLALPPQEPETALPLRELSVQVGVNSNVEQPSDGRKRHSQVLSVQYMGSRDLFWGLHPIAVLGLGDGYGYGTLGVAKPLHYRNFVLTPSFGPTLYSSGHGVSEALQFRTSIELQYKVNRYWKAGIGFYHISNATMTNASANADVSFISIQKSF